MYCCGRAWKIILRIPERNIRGIANDMHQFVYYRTKHATVGVKLNLNTMISIIWAISHSNYSLISPLTLSEPAVLFAELIGLAHSLTRLQHKHELEFARHVIYVWASVNGRFSSGCTLVIVADFGTANSKVYKPQTPEVLRLCAQFLETRFKLAKCLYLLY